MAPRTCPECGKEMLDGAEECYSCGYSPQRKQEKKAGIRKLILAAVILAALALAAVFVVLPAVRRLSFRAVGSVVTFGTYPQKADGADSTPIEWLVLDVQGDRALLLSCRGLDTKQYHTEKTGTTWESCSLRTWLNGEFLERAFSEKEQAGILTTDVDNGRDQDSGSGRRTAEAIPGTGSSC